MTRCKDAAEAGYGRIGASFREVPASSLDLLTRINSQMAALGMGGILKIGYAGHALLDIPVADGRIGLICAGGLNSVSALVESGIPVKSKALSGLVEFDRLFPYTELYDALHDIRSGV